MTAKLFIDEDHNALGIVEDHPDGVVTVDHGFNPEDFDRVLAVMERYGKSRFVGEGAALWSLNAHRQIVLSAVVEAMSSVGYSTDPLDSRTIVPVDSEQAMSYSRRPGREVVVAEAVERGLRGHIDVAFGVLGALGDVTLQEVRHVRRGGTDSVGRPLPLTRARVLVVRPLQTVAEVRTQLRAALKPIGDIVVRASVDETENGYQVEVALAPNRETVSTFIRAKLPAFESKGPVRGARMARFRLDEVPPKGVVAALRERSAACTAATNVLHPNGRTVMFRVPCTMIEGSAVADSGFSQRIAWLADQMAEYGPDLESVGEVESVLMPEGNQEALRALNEIPISR